MKRIKKKEGAKKKKKNEGAVEDEGSEGDEQQVEADNEVKNGATSLLPPGFCLPAQNPSPSLQAFAAGSDASKPTNSSNPLTGLFSQSGFNMAALGGAANGFRNMGTSATSAPTVSTGLSVQGSGGSTATSMSAGAPASANSDAQQQMPAPAPGLGGLAGMDTATLLKLQEALTGGGGTSALLQPQQPVAPAPSLGTNNYGFLNAQLGSQSAALLAAQLQAATQGPSSTTDNTEKKEEKAESEAV